MNTMTIELKYFVVKILDTFSDKHSQVTTKFRFLAENVVSKKFFCCVVVVVAFLLLFLVHVHLLAMILT